MPINRDYIEDARTSTPRLHSVATEVVFQAYETKRRFLGLHRVGRFPHGAFQSNSYPEPASHSPNLLFLMMLVLSKQQTSARTLSCLEAICQEERGPQQTKRKRGEPRVETTPEHLKHRHGTCRNTHGRSPSYQNISFVQNVFSPLKNRSGLDLSLPTDQKCSSATESVVDMSFYSARASSSSGSG